MKLPSSCVLAGAALTAAFALSAPARAQLPPVPVPANNPITQDKVNLGKALFWDEQLSSTRTVACGTCHRPTGGGADPRTAFAVNPGPDGAFGTADDVLGSPGVPQSEASGIYTRNAIFGFDEQVTGRIAPTAINAAFNVEQFWDGREGGVFKDPLSGAVVLNGDASLENQAANPPVGPSEMSHLGRDWQDVADRVAASSPLALATSVPTALDSWINGRSYQQLFQQVFGDSNITPARILMAIATYERILISDQTPFDLDQLTPMQRWGLDLFNDKARCSLCHEGNLFRDNSYHNIGLRPADEDLGRFAVSNLPEDRGAFKTPGLRNVGLRSAFMHNGAHRSLAEVIEFYDRGGDFFDNLDPKMQPLGLTFSEKTALLDFLENGLTDPRVANRMPPFDPPGLYADATRVPQHFGDPVAGSGGFEPRLIALEPPMLGNPNATICLVDGLGGAQAVLAFDAQKGFGLPAFGVPMWVLGTGAMVLVPLGPLDGAGDGQGAWSGTFPMPVSSVFNGVKIYLQAFVVDPGGPQGIVTTDGLEMILFQGR